MAQGDQPQDLKTGKKAGGETDLQNSGTGSRIELAQAAFQGNYGRRWFEPQSSVDMRQGAASPADNPLRPGWDKIPLDQVPGIDRGWQLQVNRNGKVAILIDPDGKQKPVQMSSDGAQISIGDKKYFINPATKNEPSSLDRQTETGTERVYANGTKVRFDSEGKFIERREDVKAADGSVFTPHYGANGKIDRYEITKNGQTIETGTKLDGKMLVKRVGADQQLHPVESLKDRADVIMRPNGKLDYLDRDGYGLPDENGRRIKRSDRAVMGLAQGRDGQPVQYPINPITSIRNADGQVDYTYAPGQQGQSGGLNGYTIRNREGKIIEFAHVVPSNMSSSGTAVWLEYRAKPGQAPMPEEQVRALGNALSQTDPAEVAKSLQYLKSNPLGEYMQARQRGSETTGVYLDQVTGKQANTYADGSSRVRSEEGDDLRILKDPRTGETIEVSGDGTKRRRALDSDPDKNYLDRTTTTIPGPGGIDQLQMFHMRSGNQAFMKVGYGKDGVTPNEIFFATPPNKAIRMAPDPSNPKNWLEYETKDDRTWVRATTPDGAPKAAIPMRVDLAGANTVVNGDKVPPGSIVIAMRPDDPEHFYTRIYTPTGLEVHEYPGKPRERQIKPSQVQTMPDGKTTQEIYAPPGQQRQTVPDPRDPRNRRAPYQPGVPGADPRIRRPKM